MRFPSSCSCLALAVPAWLVITEAAVGQPARYAVIEVAGLEASDVCPCFFGMGINDAGTVTGRYFAPSGDRHAFRWSEGTMIDLGTLGGPETVAIAINDLGHIAGYSETTPEVAHAYVYQGGVMIDLGTLGGVHSNARDINNSGQVVGSARGPEPDHYNRAVLWQDGTAIDLGTVGGAYSKADGINDAGVVVGWAWNTDSKRRAFRWSGNEGMIELGDLGGEASEAHDINDAGTIVGSSHTDEMEVFIGIPIQHAFLWNGADMIDLGTLPEAGPMGPYGPQLVHTEAAAVNSAGQVVGNSFPNGSERPGPFIYENGQMLNVNDLLVAADSGWTIHQANDVNDAGQIAGTAIIEGGGYRAVLLDPVPLLPGDVNGNGVVDVDDLIAVILAWGPCSQGPCFVDVDGSGVVDVIDLVLVILHWS